MLHGEIGATTDVEASTEASEYHGPAVARRIPEPGEYGLKNLRRLAHSTLVQQLLATLAFGDVPRVRKVLADTFAVHPDGEAIYQRGIAGSSDLPAMAEARVDVLIAQPADPEVRREVVETMSRIDPAAYRIGAKAVWLADQRDRVADIRMPTLVICGEDDKPTPPALSQELHAMIAGSQLAMVPNAGHLTNLEQPAEFNRLVDEFIAPLG